jgi:hypothetical protein
MLSYRRFGILQPLPRQRWRPLELQDQLPRDRRFVDDAPSRSSVHLSGNVSPSLAFQVFGQQMTLHKLADDGERGQGHQRIFKDAVASSLSAE